MTNYIRAFGYLQALLRQSFWSREKLERLQEKKLRAMVRYAYGSSPFYNRWFKSAGVKPDDIRTRADLNLLPVVRKEEFVNYSSEFVSNDYDRSSLKVSRTSGSTGKPKLVWLSSSEDELRKAKHLRAQIALGQRPWDKWATITTPSHFGETSRLQRIFRFFGVFPLSVFEDVQTQITKLKQFEPDIVDGFSSSIFLLARDVKKNAIDSIRPRFLVSGADLIGSDSRKFVEDVFAVPFYDQYATIEFERIAWQCKEKREYHIDADTLIVQFLGDDGEEVSPGEKGEIVCTSLFNYAMPFIRYGLDDIGVKSDAVGCECGRNLPLMKVIEGRKCMLIALPGGRVLAPLAFTSSVLTFRQYSCIDLFRVIQKRRDLIVFRLKLKEPVADQSSFEREFVRHVRTMLGFAEELSVEVDFVDEIPLDKSGKFQLVISEVGNALQS